MHPKLFASKKAMMRSIRTIIQLYLCFAGLSALAQTQEVFYLNSKQNPAKDEDTLYIRHVVVDMDSLFQVEDYSFPDSTLSRKSTIRIKYFDAEGSDRPRSMTTSQAAKQNQQISSLLHYNVVLHLVFPGI